MNQASVSALAAWALALNAFAWGVSWWPFRQLQELGLHPLWSTALVYALCLAALLVLRPATWRLFAGNRMLWLLAIAAGLTNLGFNWAVTVGDVVRVVLLFYLMPAWVVVLAWPLLGERPNTAALARLVLALAGVVLVLTTPESVWPWPQSIADWLALMGGLAFALTNITLRKLRATSPASGMLAMFAGSAVLATAAALAGQASGVVDPLPSPSMALVIGLAGLCMLILVANVGLQYGASRLPANVTSLIMLSEIVVATGSSTLLGASELTTRMVTGGALILLAALLSAWYAGESAEPQRT